VVMATAKSRIICRGRTRKGNRPSYKNEKGVFWTSSRLSNCNGCRGVRERGEDSEASEDIWNEKDEGDRKEGWVRE
jgi:hypothetical protein